MKGISTFSLILLTIIFLANGFLFAQSEDTTTVSQTATDEKTYLHIACQDAWLSLKDIQIEGKKRMKAVGNVEIPQSAFLAVLSIDDE